MEIRRTRAVWLLWALAAASSFSWATTSSSILYVSNGTVNPDSVLTFDAITGAFDGVFSPGGGGTAGLGAGRQPFFGPDGDFYLVDALNGNILRFQPGGTPLGVFATGDLPVPAVGAAFGPDGNLYVSDQGNGTIVKFNGSTGALIGVLASVNSVSGIVFDPNDGSLLATRVNAGVVKVDPNNGSQTTFIASASGGLNGTQAAAYGPDGNLYVSSFLSNQILEYDGNSGAFIKAFASINTPRGIAIDPSGNVFAVDVTDNTIDEFNPGGSVIQTFSGNGLSAPNYITLSAPLPEPGSLILVASAILIFSRTRQPNGSYTIRANARLVNADVTVLDKRTGKPIDDLTPSDFRAR